jgi:hypothetical protein
MAGTATIQQPLIIRSISSLQEGRQRGERSPRLLMRTCRIPNLRHMRLMIKVAPLDSLLWSNTITVGADPISSAVFALMQY